MWEIRTLLAFGRWHGEGMSLLWLNSVYYLLFQIIKRQRFEICGHIMQMGGGGILVGGTNCLCGRIIFYYNYWACWMVSCGVERKIGGGGSWRKITPFRLNLCI